MEVSGEKRKQTEGRRLPFHLHPSVPSTPFFTYWEVIEKCTKSVTKCQQVQNALTCAKRVPPKNIPTHINKQALAEKLVNICKHLPTILLKIENKV